MWLRAVTFYLDVGLARENLFTAGGANIRQAYIHCKLLIESREKKTSLKHSHVAA